MTDPIPRRKGRPKGFHSKDRPPVIQALDRAVDVLDRLAAHDGLTLSELAQALDQSPATMYRVLATLEARQMVEPDPTKQTWHVGPAAFRLGSAFLRRSSLFERSRPVLRDLMQATGETANLGIARAGQVMFIGQVETQESIRAFFPPGTLSPMHASGIGKALLSTYVPERLARFLDAHELQQFTGRTITTPEQLATDLDLARSRGWAFDDEEKAAGMRCVAAPVFDVYGEAVAGISVSGPSARMKDADIARIGALVRDAASEISRGLGAGP